VLVGIVVLKSAAMARYMNASVPGVTVPEPIIKRLADAPKDGRRKVAVEIAAELVRAMRPMCQGAHLMTLGWDDLAAEIIARSGA
jgi:methylenetetrahydrofolate reductase (NADPH)